MEKRQVSLNHVLIRWVLANSTEMTVELILALTLTGLPLDKSSEVTLGIFGVLVGAFIGFSQWFVLRSRITLTSHWILITAIGLGIGMIVMESADGFLTARGQMPFSILPLASTVLSNREITIEPLRSLLAGVVIGAILGIAQWFTLRQHVKRSGLWIIGNSLAIAASVGIRMILIGHYWSDEMDVFIQGFIFVLIVPIVFALITGIFLAWLLSIDRGKIETPQPEQISNT